MKKRKVLYTKPYEFHDEGSWDIFLIGRFRNSKVNRKRRMLVGGKR